MIEVEKLTYRTPVRTSQYLLNRTHSMLHVRKLRHRDLIWNQRCKSKRGFIYNQLFVSIHSLSDGAALGIVNGKRRRTFGDDTQRPFRTDKELRGIKASSRFSRTSFCLDHLSVREDDGLYVAGPHADISIHIRQSLMIERRKRGY